MSFNSDHRDNQHETLYMLVDQSQVIPRNTNLLLDNRSSTGYPAVKMESYDPNLMVFDPLQRQGSMTREFQQQLPIQLQDSLVTNQMIIDGECSFNKGVTNFIPSSSDPLQMPDSRLSSATTTPSVDTADYSKSYMNIYMAPSEAVATSDSSSIPRTSSALPQRSLTTSGAGSQDLEGGSSQQNGATSLGPVSLLSERDSQYKSDSNVGSPLTGPNILQQSENSYFTTASLSPIVSNTKAPTTSIAAPMSPPSATETIESPEEIAFRRAEQNRAAQRAFRQRKQKYIKWLESKAEELDEVYRILALVRTENQQLCNLVIELDEKLNQSGSKGTSDISRVKQLSSSSFLALGPGPPVSDSETAMVAENEVSRRGMDTAHTKSEAIRSIDSPLGREISMRLMNLASFPGPGGSIAEQDAAMLRKLKYHPRSLSIGKFSTGGNSSNTKSKINPKGNQQYIKRMGTEVHGALPNTVYRQQQLQQREQVEHRQKKPKQQQQHLQTERLWISSSPLSASPSSPYSPPLPYPDARPTH
ncbi:hypothetical protein FBU30_004835, partial [Linnemannia zychae]